MDNNKNLSDDLELKVVDYNRIVTKKDIMNNIYDKRIEFILEKGIDNIASKSKDYDTRDSD